MTSGAWGNQEDATQEVSPRLTQEGGLGSPVPGVKGIPGRRPRLERPRGVKGRGVGGGPRLGVDKRGQWWDLVGDELSVSQGLCGQVFWDRSLGSVDGSLGVRRSH